MIDTFFAWVQKAWWHWPVAYAAGYVAYVTTAVIVWGFIYRPCISVGQNFPFQRGKPWDAEDVVIYAFLQGIFWPPMIAILAFIVFCNLIKATFVNITKGGNLVATQVVKAVPNVRPAGFQVKHLTLVKSLLTDSKTPSLPTGRSNALSRVERG